MSPLARIFAGILAVLAVIGALLFGIFVFAVVFGLAVLLMILVSIRNWWLRRKAPEPQTPQAQRRQETIDAEYTVISRRRD